MNIKSTIFRLILLPITLFVLYGCGTSPENTNTPSSEPDVIFQGSTQGKEEVQTLAINNCDGKSNLVRTEQRTQSVDVTISSEIAVKLGVSAEIISTEVQAAVNLATTQGGSRSTSIQLTAPPQTHMYFQLVWTGDEQIGVVQNLRGSDMPIVFQGFTPTDVYIESQIDFECPNSVNVQEATTIELTSIPQSYPTAQSTNSIATIAPTAMPNINSCPNWTGEGFALSNGLFKAGTAITGPAALHPFQGSYELGKALGFDYVPSWGINIPSSQSVIIPSSVTLVNGPIYSPEGSYELYLNEDDIAVVQQRWLQYCP